MHRNFIELIVPLHTLSLKQIVYPKETWRYFQFPTLIIASLIIINPVPPHSHHNWFF